ncbi:MAG TPA: cupin domain-containing protein [Thermoanaerobaculia bacterium]|jgi:mannose-6-phosphate isomerase-like protein (cupin superfamily)|nr:cupin domain-containing protein [Thermoanaerobaculia bacterium]
MDKVVSPLDIASRLPELWSPRVVAEVDDSFVKVAKVHGSLTWHSHDDEDELFYILKGVLRIEMEDRTVELKAGEAFVVPKGVRHNPIAEEECLVMLFERKSTLHTGSEVTEKTRSVEEQLRPV